MKVEGTSTLYYPPSMDTGFQDVFAPQLLINIYNSLPSAYFQAQASWILRPHGSLHMSKDQGLSQTQYVLYV